MCIYENRVVATKDVIAKCLDARTLLGKANTQVTTERKERIRSAPSEDIQGLCDQDHSLSTKLLVDFVILFLKRNDIRKIKQLQYFIKLVKRDLMTVTRRRITILIIL